MISNIRYDDNRDVYQAELKGYNDKIIEGFDDLNKDDREIIKAIFKSYKYEINIRDNTELWVTIS